MAELPRPTESSQVLESILEKFFRQQQDQLGERLTKMEGHIDALRMSAPMDLAVMKERLGRIESEVQGLREAEQATAKAAQEGLRVEEERTRRAVTLATIIATIIASILSTVLSLLSGKAVAIETLPPPVPIVRETPFSPPIHEPVDVLGR